MIKTAIFSMDNVQFKRTFSDENCYIQKVGTNEIYTEAIDILDFEYEETDIPVEEEKEESLEKE